MEIEIFIGLAAAVTIITQLIKSIPVSITSDYPKTVAWIVMSIIVGVIGCLEGASLETILSIGVAMGLAANGFYDVVSAPIAKFIQWTRRKR